MTVGEVIAGELLYGMLKSVLFGVVILIVVSTLTGPCCHRRLHSAVSDTPRLLQLYFGSLLHGDDKEHRSIELLHYVGHYAFLSVRGALFSGQQSA